MAQQERIVADLRYYKSSDVCRVSPMVNTIGDAAVKEISFRQEEMSLRFTADVLGDVKKHMQLWVICIGS